MRTKQPSDPSKRKLVGFFEVPPVGSSNETVDAWTNSILDAMERVDREDAANERGAKRPPKKRGKENEL